MNDRGVIRRVPPGAADGSVDGRAPHHLDSFHGGDVVAFDWSPDGRYLAYIRVTRSSDVVRLRSFLD